jgi:predicted RNase H-like nuclease
MQNSFILCKRLGELHYMPYPHENASHQWIEVYPHAAYTTLLGRIPFAKHTFEGRIQRQLVLYEENLNVPDPMRIFEEITRHRMLHGVVSQENLYLPDELDALVSAYTAQKAANQPDQVMLVGDPEEGQIVLPVSTLKAHY